MISRFCPKDGMIQSVTHITFVAALSVSGLLTQSRDPTPTELTHRCKIRKTVAGWALPAPEILVWGACDPHPFSCFIFDPTQSAFKKFGNPELGRFSMGNTFVLLKKHCRVFLIPDFRIRFVTLFQNRNTLSTAEGSLPAAVFGGGRARPAYRLYPA